MLHFIFDFSARLRRESNENRFRLKKNQYHPILDLEIMRKVDESKIYCSLLDLFEELILILVHYLIPRPETKRLQGWKQQLNIEILRTLKINRVVFRS